MNDGLPTGPGRRLEGPAETPGSSRPRVVRGVADDDMDRPAGPGVRPPKTAEQKVTVDRALKRGERPEPLGELWARLMIDALQGKMATHHVDPRAFNASVKRLREEMGDEKVRRAIEEFAASVKAGRIEPGAKPWFRFVARAPKLGQGVGVNTVINQSRSKEDWLRRPTE